MAEVLREECVKVGFEISNSETNVTKIHGERGFTMQGEKITEVEISIFLGSGVTCNGNSTTEIKTRLAMAKVKDNEWLAT